MNLKLKKEVNQTWAIIPSRSNSKSIKNKNLQKINNKSLLRLTIEVAKKTNKIDRTFVSTEKKSILQQSIKWGSENIPLRKKENALDFSTDIDVLLDFFKSWFKKNNIYPKNIMYLRPTTPLRNSKILNRAIIKFDQVTGTAKLWINPTLSTDTSISGSDAGAATIVSFDLRQSDSQVNETVRVDNLMIGQTFANVLVYSGDTLSVSEKIIQGFTSYPNPVNNGRLTVTTSNSNEKEVSIYSVLGKRVFAQKFSGNNKQFDVSQINSGIYIMKVIEGEKVATKKLIIK